jgi:hypothetical protein
MRHKVKGIAREWGRDVRVIVFDPDPGRKRLRARMERLRQLDERLQRLSPLEQWMLPVILAILTGSLAVWFSFLLPPPDPHQFGFESWFGL